MMIAKMNANMKIRKMDMKIRKSPRRTWRTESTKMERLVNGCTNWSMKA